MLEYILGIAGTAKNTGKTTTTNAILACLRKRGIAVFLTSIGYDGENLDNVTGLPKPKIPVEPGDIIATGTPPGVGAGMKPPRCLKAGDVVELGIDGLGRQRQIVIAERTDG